MTIQELIDLTTTKRDALPETVKTEPCPEGLPAGTLIPTTFVEGGYAFKHWDKCRGGCKGTGLVAIDHSRDH